MNMHFPTNFVANPPIAHYPIQPRQPISSSNTTIASRYTDPKNIDISSIKGRFAWEKIPDSDTYIPVIFRGETKYFCVKILRKVLRDLPEDIYHRWDVYQYRKPIELGHVTSHEIKLLNRINVHHARWSYTRQGFNLADEIIRVSDFLPYYQYIRQILKQNTVQTLKNNPSLIRHPSNPVQNVSLRPPIVNGNLRATVCNPQVSSSKRPSFIQNPYVPPTVSSVDPIRNSYTAYIPIIQPTATPTTNHSSSTIVNNTTACSTINRSSESRPPVVSASISETNSINTKSIVSRPIVKVDQTETLETTQNINSLNEQKTRQPSISNVDKTSKPLSSVNSAPKEKQTTTKTPNQSHKNDDSSTVPVLSLSSLSTTNVLSKASDDSTGRPSSLMTNKSSAAIHCGWIQINKLYTPYISTVNAKHHQYKIPVSLLTYYDLMKIPSPETMNFQENSDSSKTFEQILVTQAEIDLINDQCLKHNLRTFSSDTKLVTLETFYQFCTPTMIFVKELPLNEPKAAICKDWSTVIEMNGGICRLRNVTTLNEQTVPFVGNNLLKNFVLSSSTLSTASLIKPTTGEMEFLQLILFYSNLSINVRNAQLIDIESVKKEYNVDLILLFNDKFALNVLNYQEKGNRPNISQNALLQPTNSAPSNTIAESTPPPSPPSPPMNQATLSTRVSSKTSTDAETTTAATTTIAGAADIKGQLPLTNSSTSNRYQRTVEFNGHRLTAFICSGIGSNAQRECISVRSLCEILAPEYPNIEKLEMKMLRLLRSKNVNRFRPQNQQSTTFTRLIDIRDAKEHWTFLEQEIRLTMTKQTETSSISTEASKSSDPDNLVNIVEPVKEVSVEKTRSDKRGLDDEPLDDDDVPVTERLNKRIRVDETKTDKEMIASTECSSNATRLNSIEPITTTSTLDNPKKKPRRPRDRSNRQSKASWVKKYSIEDCCIRLDPCQIETGPDNK